MKTDRRNLIEKLADWLLPPAPPEPKLIPVRVSQPRRPAPRPDN